MCINPLLQDQLGLARKATTAEKVQKQTTIGTKSNPAPGWGYDQLDALKINNQNLQLPSRERIGNLMGLKGDETIQTKKDISGDSGPGTGGGGMNY